MDKQTLRERVWRELEAKGVATFPKPVKGRIPNFVGSRQAAEKLCELDVYRSAKVIMINPDAAQLAVRELALRDGKRLLVATPKLRKGFVMLDPLHIPNPREAASIGGALKYGLPVDLSNLKVDLVVEGSVAVDRGGGRAGKGSGFGDLKVAILRELGAIDDSTPVVTTVHELQVVEEVPMTEHDVQVDIIVTPERVIETEHRHPKPRGIIWGLLSSDDFERMPILAELKEKCKK